MRTKNHWLNLLGAVFAVGLSACAAQVSDGDGTGGERTSADVTAGGGANSDPSVRNGGDRENVRTTTSALSEQVAEPHPDPWSPNGEFDPNEPHPDPWSPHKGCGSDKN